jgi:NAD(P)-dependent dehydrogenase (short-subunit alcohol dehydrogenase family)
VSRLAGRIALVTGASRGIGLAIARVLSAEGARVVRVSRSLPQASTSQWVDLPCDLSDPAAVEGLAARVHQAAGVPDLVVNNAGSFLLAPVEETTSAAFAEQLAANLTLPFLVSRAFLPGMRARGSGRLILIGSIADHVALPGNSAYAAAKYGARGLHEVLREELRGSGILCSLISPGPTDTGAWDPVNPDARAGFIPRARMLRPGDVADAVRWVAGLPGHVEVDWLRLGPAR